MTDQAVNADRQADGQTDTGTDTSSRTRTGRVTSTAMEQTATVLIERRVKHPVYGKYVRKSKKFHVHDGDNALNVGDIVQIRECRPISRTKSWTLDKVLTAASE